jgi:hypothetical protein
MDRRSTLPAHDSTDLHVVYNVCQALIDIGPPSIVKVMNQAYTSPQTEQ